MGKSNSRPKLRKLPSGNDSSSALASLAEPLTIKVTVSAGAEDETDGKIEIEEGNRPPEKKHLSS